jgi:HD-GYP domain-containing protein (c-di-GMP phosphodiesterase class II)
MTSPRPYRPTPLSSEDALNELMRLAGSEFDPNVVRVVVAEVRAEIETEQAA